MKFMNSEHDLFASESPSMFQDKYLDTSDHPRLHPPHPYAVSIVLPAPFPETLGL